MFGFILGVLMKFFVIFVGCVKVILVVGFLLIKMVKLMIFFMLIVFGCC